MILLKSRMSSARALGNNPANAAPNDKDARDMNKTGDRLRVRTLVLAMAASFSVAGCLDSGSSSDSSDPEPNDPAPPSEPNQTATVTGKAAQGAPLGKADIEALCSDGSGFVESVIAEENGFFSGEVDLEALPCKLRAISETDDLTLHSLVEDDGVRSNITLFTDLVMQLAAVDAVDVWFDQTDLQFNEQDLSQAMKELNATLNNQGYGIDVDEDHFGKSFSIGDGYDVQMDGYRDGIENNPNLESHDDVLTMLRENGVQKEFLPESPNHSDGSPGEPEDGPFLDPSNPAEPAAQMRDDFNSQMPVTYEQSRGAWDNFIQRNMEYVGAPSIFVFQSQDYNNGAQYVADKEELAWPITNLFYFYGEFSSGSPLDRHAEIEALPSEPFPGAISLNDHPHYGSSSSTVVSFEVSGPKSIGGLKYMNADIFKLQSRTVDTMWGMEHFNVDELDISGTPISSIQPLSDFGGSVLSLGTTGVTDISPLKGKEFDELNISYLGLESWEPLMHITINDEIEVRGLKNPHADTGDDGVSHPYSEGLPPSAQICSDPDVRITRGYGESMQARRKLCQVDD